MQIDGKPWFDRNAMCQILDIKNPHKIMERLSLKGVTSIHTLTNGGMQNKIFINKGNLYRLIAGSRKPQAEAFIDWVCDVVLPQIRQTGNYISPTASLLDAAEQMIQVLRAQDGAIRAHGKQNMAS